MTFEEEYPIKGDLVLSYVNPKDGMVFRIKPLMSLEMDNEQFKAEYKVAIIKLNEAVKEWNDKHLDKARVKEAIEQEEFMRDCCGRVVLVDDLEERLGL